MMNEKCVAIIISYYPDEAVFENLRILSEQIENIIIVDNGSTSDDQLKLLGLQSQQINVILLKTNIGIAGALNIGINNAMKSGFNAVFTFDQDSRVSKNFIDSMLAVLNHNGNKKKVALIAPQYVSFADKRESHLLYEVRKIETAMTSGNLLNLDLIKDRFPLFNADLFIDYVDFDFCLGLSNDGFCLLQSLTTFLFHNLGNKSKHKFLGIECTTTNHSALRRYYISRNRIYVYKKFILSNTAWVIHDIVSFIKELIKILCFEKNKQEKMKMTAKGIIDALFHRFGKYDRD